MPWALPRACHRGPAKDIRVKTILDSQSAPSNGSHPGCGCGRPQRCTWELLSCLLGLVCRIIPLHSPHTHRPSVGSQEPKKVWAGRRRQLLQQMGLEGHSRAYLAHVASWQLPAAGLSHDWGRNFAAGLPVSVPLSTCDPTLPKWPSLWVFRILVGICGSQNHQAKNGTFQTPRLKKAVPFFLSSPLNPREMPCGLTLFSTQFHTQNLQGAWYIAGTQ